MSAELELFASCAPGLEALLDAELASHAIGQGREIVPGGVEFRGSMLDVHRANRWLGCAQQIRIRVARLTASKLPELARKSRALEWDAFIDPKRELRIQATTRKSRLYHTGAVAQRVRDGLQKRLGAELPEGDGQRVHVRVQGTDVVISIDASGDPLHRRGYRLQSSKAPLREDLAFALVAFSGWDRRSPLVDPMAGSGTIAIEAARMARGAAPGGQREFAADTFPSVDLEELATAREGLQGSTPGAVVFASDRDAGAVDSIRANAERAGVELVIAKCAISDALTSGDAHAIVTNPPYGRRVGKGRDLRPLYQSLGRLSGERPLTLVGPAKAPLFAQTGRVFQRELETQHGGSWVAMRTTQR